MCFPKDLPYDLWWGTFDYRPVKSNWRPVDKRNLLNDSASYNTAQTVRRRCIKIQVHPPWNSKNYQTGYVRDRLQSVCANSRTIPVNTKSWRWNSEMVQQNYVLSTRIWWSRHSLCVPDLTKVTKYVYFVFHFDYRIIWRSENYSNLHHYLNAECSKRVIITEFKLWQLSMFFFF